MRSEVKVRGDDLQDLLALKTRELEESEARFRGLFEGIPEILLVHDAGGRILLANDVGAFELERSSRDLVGCNLRDLMPPADADKVIAAAVRAHNEGSATFEASTITPSGRRLELAFNSRAIEFEGRPAVLSVARDITAQKTADQQRAEFMATVAHDIRNPLSVVVGYAEMLRETEGLDSDRTDMLARLVSNARAVVSLVSNYLDLSRIEAGRLILDSAPVEVNAVLETLGDLYEDEARLRQVELSIVLDESRTVVRGDGTALERVLGNLVHNAIKYTPPRGHIGVRCETAGDSLTISVSDTGPGIPAEEVAGIFDRYSRTFAGRSKHGSGLGLFIARTLIEAQGGSITVRPRPGGGCVFSVHLPVPAERPVRPSRPR